MSFEISGKLLDSSESKKKDFIVAARLPLILEGDQIAVIIL